MNIVFRLLASIATLLLTLWILLIFDFAGMRQQMEMLTGQLEERLSRQMTRRE